MLVRARDARDHLQECLPALLHYGPITRFFNLFSDLNDWWTNAAQEKNHPRALIAMQTSERTEMLNTFTGYAVTPAVASETNPLSISRSQQHARIKDIY